MAEWHFGGGAGYCGGCAPGGCGEKCPYQKNAPESWEGWQVWDLVLRFSSQLRVAMSGQVIGFDLPALLRAGELLGYECGAVAEMMPAAEGGMLRGLRKLTAGLAGEGDE